MMGLGMMIGAGVFVGIGLSIEGAGPGGLMLTMALNGLIALFTAMSFAELSSAIPRAGGVYNFARIGFGRRISFIAGWMEWLASSAAGGFYAIVFATYTIGFMDDLFGLGLQAGGYKPHAVRAAAILVAGFFIFINYRGSAEAGKWGAVFTLGQMAFVLTIGAVGIITAILRPERLANFHPFMPGGWWKLLGTMGVIYVAFEGFEVIAQAGDETREPRRNIPKAMLYSVMIVTVTYCLVAFASVVAFSGTGSIQQWFTGADKVEGFKKAVESLLPAGWGSLLVVLAVVFSSTSALNATVFSATRASYALGRDRMLPHGLARISPKRRTPSAALAMTGVIIFIVAMTLNPKDAAAMASMMFLLLFFLVNLCVIRIRRNMGDELEYGYLMPLFPVLPILAIVCQGALCGGIFQESKIAVIIAAAWIAAGALIYSLYSKSHAAATEDEIQALDDQARLPAVPAPETGAHPAPQGEYRIMVSVGNPDNALEMVQTTYRLSGAKDARVELLHMVPVPDQVPLSDAEQYMLEGKEGIIETMLYLAPLFPISTTLRYCRNIARGIVSAVREKKADMLIMGWHGSSGARRAFNLGSTVDPVIERSPCDVVVLKNCGGDRQFKRVLVPLAGGPNGPLALEVASILADKDNGEVVVFTAADTKRVFDPAQFVADNRDRLAIPAERIHTKITAADQIVDAILNEAEDYDLVVIGCTEQPLLYKVTRASVPETVARLCRKPLVMVKSSGGIRSWLQRWI